jgi:hypothetical protein
MRDPSGAEDSVERSWPEQSAIGIAAVLMEHMGPSIGQFGPPPTLPVFTCADGLKTACAFCAALGIVHRGVKHVPQLLNAGIHNGTVTFIEYEGQFFAVTCEHVLQVARDRNVEYGPDTFVCATLKDGIFGISDTFRQPYAPVGSSKRPDIAITRIPADFASRIGKQFFALTNDAEQRPTSLSFGVAHGYPTEEKWHAYDRDGYQIQMPCVQALAEAMGSETQFLSVLPVAPDIGHLSGMSGGPVFWSTAYHFGLIGFIYEGNRTAGAQDVISAPRIHFFVELCGFQRFGEWVHELRLNSTPEAEITDLSFKY